MTPQRDGYHNLNTQIPDAAWEALVIESERRGESVAKVLTRILQGAFKIPDGKIPKPKRTGRKPKKR